jgi:hypothetical protein
VVEQALRFLYDKHYDTYPPAESRESANPTGFPAPIQGKSSPLELRQERLAGKGENLPDPTNSTVPDKSHVNATVKSQRTDSGKYNYSPTYVNDVLSALQLR